MLVTNVMHMQRQPACAPEEADVIEEIEGAQQHCLQACPECARLGLRVGCNRESGHVGVHHCSNYNQGPHEW